MHSMIGWRLLLCFAMLVPLALGQQEKSPPGLDFLVGKWIVEGEMKAQGPRPASKMTSREDCAWFEGHVAVVCQIESNVGDGHSKGMSIHSYEPKDDAYTYYAINSVGSIENSHGKGNRDEVTWDGSLDFHGHPTHTRLKIRRVDADTEKVQLETISSDGTPTLLMEGFRKRQH